MEQRGSQQPHPPGGKEQPPAPRSKRSASPEPARATEFPPAIQALNPQADALTPSSAGPSQASGSHAGSQAFGGLSNEPLEDFARMDFSDDLPDAYGIPNLAGQLPRAQPRPLVIATAVEDEAPPVVAGQPINDAQTAEDELHASSRRRLLLTTAPSWLISLLVHIAIILLLAAITLDPVNKVISILQASVSDKAAEIESFDLQGPSIDSIDMPMDEPLTVPTTEVTPVVSMPQLQTPMLDVSSAQPLEMNALTESILPSALLNSSSQSQMSAVLNSRSSAQKSEMLERFGGNAASEKAVAMALKWMAEHQARNGGWTFAHNTVCRNQCGDPGDLGAATNAATAMALLPFLGAGQTHIEGQYKKTVKDGLSFLINRMQVENGELPSGSWHEPGGRMYSHGLAAITVCEAYAMTGDPDLLQPAQLSLNYLINSQDPRGGGWRYEPGQAGDTSVVGWCVMALKSGKMGHLVVPQQTFYGAKNFLDFVSTNNGAYYGYDEPTANIDSRQATTAVGLLCRMYMGVPKEQAGIKAGVEFLSKRGPSTSDLYYSYYATQVMRQYGGPEWEDWNRRLRDDLIKLQSPEGSHAAGSWYTQGPHSEKGGRLYATSLATMILEVYYRHMPLYSQKSSQDDFEI